MDAGRRHKTLRSEEKGSIIPSTADDMNFMFELVPLILQDPQGAAMQSQVDAAHVGHLHYSWKPWAEVLTLEMAVSKSAKTLVWQGT